MTRKEIVEIAADMAKAAGIECKGPLQVFERSDQVGLRFRDLSKRSGDLVMKATVAVAEDDEQQTVVAKISAAIDCIQYGVQTGWNKVEPAPAPLDLRKDDEAAEKLG